MRIKAILFFAVSLAVTVLFIQQLRMPHQIAGATVPPLGDFFNPFTGFWRNAEPKTPVPGKRGSLDLPGLQAEVQVVFDENEIPHIFAQNVADAARVQGYVTAHDRLWQMDITARSSAGQVAEMVGQKALEADLTARRMGLGWTAERLAANWAKDPETQQVMQAYADGVNAYIQQLTPAKFPVEYKLLNAKPSLWTIEKTALTYLGMARNLSGNSEDLAATNTVAQFGQSTFNSLFPTWNPSVHPVVPDFGQWKSGTQKGKAEAAPPAHSSTFIPDNQGLSYSEINQSTNQPINQTTDPAKDGSNNWAIAGAKTASGHPMLASDPHLSLTLPSVWFQIQIHLPEANVYGISRPGSPGVVIGFNEHIAWGLTNGGEDVVDWYKIQWSDAARTHYIVDGQTLTADLRVEKIEVAGGQPVLDTVRYTIWGPLPHGSKPGHPYRDYAMKWTGHDATVNSSKTMRGLNLGKNFADYQNALASWGCPAQNFAFASRDGDIAIQAQANFPIRKPGQGRTAQDGSLRANDWGGFIPQNRMPMMRNPRQGFVQSANQYAVPPSYPYPMPGSYADWRNRHIFNWLANAKGMTLDSMEAMQQDNYSLRAALALPAFLKNLDTTALSDSEKSRLAELRKWDFRYAAAATAPSLFETWFDTCYARTFDEMFALREKKMDVMTPEAWRFIELLSRDPKNLIFDKQTTPARETAREIVLESFKEMVAKATGDLAWGKFRGLTINHLLQLPAFGRKFDNVGGHRTALNAQTANHGPSWRMVVEMGDTIRAFGVYPGGQSGNPGSPFYDNLLETWAAGKYNELHLMRSPEELKLPLKVVAFKPKQI